MVKQNRSTQAEREAAVCVTVLSFTTGEVAALCGLSQQTVIRCCDSGGLESFRVPGSRFRRIPRDALISFMKLNGIPLGRLAAVDTTTTEGATDGRRAD